MGKNGASIPDEEWERFLRESGAGSRDAPQEPSARARMVTRRLKEAPEPPAAWRSYQPATRRSRKGRYAVGILLAVALTLVALAPGRVVDWVSGSGGGDVAVTPPGAETARPTGPPPDSPIGEHPTLDEPFRGSPAVAWKDGTAGIHLPDAKATGWMTRAQVADALERTRDFLAASNLDPAVLRGERPTAAIALINPRQPDIRQYVASSLRTPGEKTDPLLLFSRFRPSEVRPAGDVVKTRGQLTFTEGKRGALEVTADVTFVYPLVRAAAGSEEVARTIVRRGTVVSWDDPAKVLIEPGTFSLLSYSVDTANGGCTAGTGYLTPEFAAERATGHEGRGPEVDPYDRSSPLPADRGEATECGRATRT
ncbi:hypothetical protein [Streptomyces sp. AM 2-1-1]|uniref:hypothetical protein n=1 Tax=Streptomyces sp. AM 2-1-1 TaxID=3028709 RepID=UPI0023B8BCA7|nr:hypothetical protein [Streptomyces sp. AM 2-1-1]WEH41129.1 hypothetical protein PZB77_17390 [Streptomyces sp. AM 2-1-1]